MLLVSGAWWDDWKYYVNDYFGIDMRTHYLSAGRIDAYCIIALVDQLPSYLFRLVVIMCFTLSAVLIYYILLKLFDDRYQAFIISILYNAIPVNDARVMRCVFPYTFALAIFWLGTLLLIYMLEAQKKRDKYILRIVTLILYFISFTTNSLLVYYIIPLAIIWVLEANELFENKNLHVKAYIKRVLKYLDFYILPILFWGIKNIFFHTKERYENYNEVSIGKCLSALIITGRAAAESGKRILLSWSSVVKQIPFSLFGFIIIFLVCFLLRDRISKETKHISKRYQFLGFILGGIIYLIGLFPYVVIRQGTLLTTGLSGRDAILACLGICIMVYYFMNLLSIPNWGQYAIVICVIFSSFIHFHLWYMTYIKDYYQQVALQQSWQNTDEVRDGRTFIYIRKKGNGLDTERFYSLGALSKQTYGDASRFYVCGINRLDLLTSNNRDSLNMFVKDPVDNIYQYDVNNIKIDGIMIADYNLTTKNCYKLKYEELFRHEDFLNDVECHIDYEYIPVDEEMSEQIFEMYEEGALTTNDELLKYIIDI